MRPHLALLRSYTPRLQNASFFAIKPSLFCRSSLYLGGPCTKRFVSHPLGGYYQRFEVEDTRATIPTTTTTTTTNPRSSRNMSYLPRSAAGFHAPPRDAATGDGGEASPTFLFSTFDVTAQTFLYSRLSFAFTNLKPTAPGHILISPRNPARRRYADLDPEEINDLFQMVQCIQFLFGRIFFSDPPIADAYSPGGGGGGGGEPAAVYPSIHQYASFDPAKVKRFGLPDHGSFTITVQDGVDSGQTVNHVHVHLAPRLSHEPDDVRGDAFYRKLDSERGNIGGALYDICQHNQEKKADQDLDVRPVPGPGLQVPDDELRLPRTWKEMTEEAQLYGRVWEDMKQEFMSSQKTSDHHAS